MQLRKGLAAVAVALAVWVALQALSPEPPAREQAVVAAADLAAGHRLTPSDVTLAPIHPESTPRSRTSDPGTVVGQTLGQPVEAGEVLTAARLRPARGLAALRRAAARSTYRSSMQGPSGSCGPVIGSTSSR